MIIGVPKEIKESEYRVALTPSGECLGDLKDWRRARRRG